MRRLLTVGLVLGLAIGCSSMRGHGPKPKMATAVPPQITTPDEVDTRLGTLEFFDGYPDARTTQRVYDHLDFLRGVEVFLNTMPGASLYAMREGIRSVGGGNDTLLITESLLDSKSLFLTPNTETVYVFSWLDLRDGPLVVETPPNVLGFIDDAWFRYLIDVGNAGPDKGKGGKYLVLPPGYAGPVPKGYHVARSRTFGNWLVWRGFLVDGDPGPAVAATKKHGRIYPLAQARRRPQTKFVDISGKAFNTIHANDYSYFEEIHHVVQEEPNAALDPETLGLLAAIGIEKGKPFAPDARMKKILTDAAAVGNATARAILFQPRDARDWFYPGESSWYTPVSGGSIDFLRDGARDANGRSAMFYGATGVTPAMFVEMVGVGSQYAFNALDARGNYFDGGRTYRLRIPANPPAKNFWSLVVYDTQTRSLLQTDEPFPSFSSQKSDMTTNPDGSVDVYFGPRAPEGKRNWIQTIPGKSWFTILRLYGPLQPWFDKTWRPGEIEEMDVRRVRSPTGTPKMTTDIPAAITTPDEVETRLGTLRFFDGLPDAATVEKLYDNLDFIRGVEVFLNAMPGASLVGLRTGYGTVGIADGSIGVFETLMDSRSLFLTPNTETVYALAWLDLKDGPMVVESPPKTLGVADDFWFRYVTDLGYTGPDRGRGGKYLFLPPGYRGRVPKGYLTFRSPTYGVSPFWRGFLVNGDPAPAVASIKKHARIYPLSQARRRPAQRFVNLSGRDFNTIHANDFTFYEEVNEIVQEEPTAAQDPELLGQLAAVGIEKGKPFAPDERMKRILTESAAVGNATARALTFATRDPAAFYYPGRQWKTAFVGGSHEFLHDGVRLLDGRTLFHYYATGITPAMAAKMVGTGSQYAYAERDATGAYLDGGNHYRLRLPPAAPVQTFWSLVVYDPQTRSELQTDTPFPSLNSQRSGAAKNPDGSVDVYFGPTAPAGREKNWIQTVPGKGWNVILRLYGPLEPWFDKTWRPGDIEAL